MKGIKTVVKKMMKTVGIVFIVLLVVCIGILVYLCYQNLHWWEKDMKQIEKLGVVERQVTLPNGNVADNGVYLCAAPREQAERAVAQIGDNAQLIETEDSNHNIHDTHTQIYVDAINSFLKGTEE